MRRLFVLAAAAAIVLAPVEAFAESGPLTRGGGTGTFGADLDADGDVDGSQFGFVVITGSGGSATGSFMCLMAGRSDILGLSIMSVTGRVSTGTRNPDGSVAFSGMSRVNLGGGTILRGVAYEVAVWPGGPGTGKLELTVIGAFDGVPGDTIPGNGNYDLPIETVRSGRIAVS
jgi:hypothetical protein